MRKPKQYKSLWCQGKNEANKWFHLIYTKERGFIEPITNQSAEPIIGKITHWQYDEPAPDEFQSQLKPYISSVYEPTPDKFQ